MAVKLHYRETGEGPLLLILHGLFGSSDNWVSAARKLAPYFHILIPDLRNHGQSPHTESHTYEDMNDDLELFYRLQELSPAFLLGHSMGGKLAMMFAAKNPDLAKGLIVADIAPKSYYPEKTEENDQQMLLNVMEGTDLSLYHTRLEIEGELSKKIRSITLRQFLLKNIHRNHRGHFEWKINVPVLKQYLPDIISGVNPEFFLPYKPIVGYPVTFIRGLNSNYITDTDLPLILDIYPKSHLIDIPSAGHWLHAEQTETFVRAVIEASR